MNANKNIKLAEQHYKNMVDHNFDAMEEYIDNEIELFGPFGKTTGKVDVIAGAKMFASVVSDIKIFEKFSADNKVMLAYEAIFNNNLGSARAAALITFNNDKIVKIELFYDPKPFIEQIQNHG